MRMAMAAAGLFFWFQATLVETELTVTAMIGASGARVSGVSVTVNNNTSGVTGGAGDVVLLIPTKGTFPLVVNWPDGCRREYTWQQSTSQAQHVFVQREDCR